MPPELREEEGMWCLGSVLLGLCSAHIGGFLGGLILIPWDGETNPALGSTAGNSE